MLPKTDPVAFVDSAPADAYSAPPTAGAASEHLVSGAMDNGAVDGIPGYSAIMSSELTAPEKARLLFSVSKQHIQNQFASVRPWGEFFDRSHFVSPAGTSDAVARLSRNGSHFYSNYVVLSVVCSSYVLLINLPFFICMVLAVAAYFFIRNRASDAAQGDGLIHIRTHTFTPTKLYGMLAVFAALAFWITGGSSVVFWLALTSLGISCVHAVMRRPPMDDSSFQFA